MNKSQSLSRIAAVCATALLLSSCAWKKDLDQAKSENKALTEEKVRAQKELTAAGAATAEMQGTLDEVQKGLEELRVKELQAIKTSITVAPGISSPGRTWSLRFLMPRACMNQSSIVS